jgi:hypothetical protein
MGCHLHRRTWLSRHGQNVCAIVEICHKVAVTSGAGSEKRILGGAFGKFLVSQEQRLILLVVMGSFRKLVLCNVLITKCILPGAVGWCGQVGVADDGACGLG